MPKKIKKSNVASEPKQMTLTLHPCDWVLLHIAGTGTMSIDWGDGTPCETHPLLAPVLYWTHDCGGYDFRHRYHDFSTRIITITGENVTHMETEFGILASIDVSHNTALMGLGCGRNELTNLDVSKNTALEYLNCDDTHFTFVTKIKEYGQI